MAAVVYAVTATNLVTGATVEVVDLLSIYTMGHPPAKSQFGGDERRLAAFLTNAEAVDVVAQLQVSEPFSKVYDPTTYAVHHLT